MRAAVWEDRGGRLSPEMQKHSSSSPWLGRREIGRRYLA